MWSRRMTDAIGMDENAFVRAFEKALDNDNLKSKLASIMATEIKKDSIGGV